MRAVELFSVPKILTVTHYPEERACVARWRMLSTPRFRELVTRTMHECARLGVLTFIADVSWGDPGVPSQADAKWVAGGCDGLSRESGVIALISVRSSSAIASLGTKRLRESVDSQGGSAHECATLEQALMLAAEIAAKASSRGA
jgi:hypothetical protein